MAKPSETVLRELASLRNSHTVAWLRSELDTKKSELVTHRDIDVLRSLQGQALFLQEFLGLVDGASDILNRR